MKIINLKGAARDFKCLMLSSILALTCLSCIEKAQSVSADEVYPKTSADFSKLFDMEFDGIEFISGSDISVVGGIRSEYKYIIHENTKRAYLIECIKNQISDSPNNHWKETTNCYEYLRVLDDPIHNGQHTCSLRIFKTGNDTIYYESGSYNKALPKSE